MITSIEAGPRNRTRELWSMRMELPSSARSATREDVSVSTRSFGYTIIVASSCIPTPVEPPCRRRGWPWISCAVAIR